MPATSTVAPAAITRAWRFRRDAAIDFQRDVAAAVLFLGVDALARGVDLLQLAFDEALPAEAGIDAS